MNRAEQRTLYASTPHDASALWEVELLRKFAREDRALSDGDIHRLQDDLIAHISPDDAEMLQWAGLTADNDTEATR